MGGSSRLGCMSMSMIYINTSDDERLFKQLNYFSPPLLLLFFGFVHLQEHSELFEFRVQFL